MITQYISKYTSLNCFCTVNSLTIKPQDNAQLTNNIQTKPITMPLTHACGVKMLNYHKHLSSLWGCTETPRLGTWLPRIPIKIYVHATLPSVRRTCMSILPLFSECLAIDRGDSWYQYTNLLIVSTASGGRAVAGKAWLNSASTPVKWTPVSFMIK